MSSLRLRRSSCHARRHLYRPAAGRKISRLQQAAGAFVDMWQTLRSNEASLLIEVPLDRLGVVFFDHQSGPWSKDLVASSAIDGIKDFKTLNLANEKTAINSVTPGRLDLDREGHDNRRRAYSGGVRAQP